MTTDYETLGRAMLAGIDAGTEHPDLPFYRKRIAPGEWLTVARSDTDQLRRDGFVAVTVQRSARHATAKYARVQLNVEALRDQPTMYAQIVVEQARSMIDKLREPEPR